MAVACVVSAVSEGDGAMRADSGVVVAVTSAVVLAPERLFKNGDAEA
eukprot:CAMPEP_0172486404 /NCGR_PEP_ID=MMETSP1066-20121228/14972_1 /TAXON_ID=671091 /ORGANISM="Coscinodiscus wailesii, Strain CCMP2513" /LENGTH=46 /DNA_ID= /DNA_START= /DNA_END= /DNA_ORIENTATION=